MSKTENEPESLKQQFLLDISNTIAGLRSASAKFFLVALNKVEITDLIVRLKKAESKIRKNQINTEEELEAFLHQEQKNEIFWQNEKQGS